MFFLISVNNVCYALSILLAVILPHLSTGKETCALLFFGIGRKFKEIALPAIKENVLDSNPSCDIFVHTYNVTTVVGGRIGEDETGTVDASEIFLLANNRSAIVIET